MTLRASRLLLVLVACALSACGGQTATDASSSSTLTRVSISPSDGPSEKSAPTRTARSKSADAGESEVIEDLVSFSSPSGNVGCYLDSTTVRCDIAERDWAPPPRPDNCEFDYGQGINLTAEGNPHFVCAGDTALGGGEPLPYGRSISAGSLQCDSTEAGITCRDTETGNGFSIAREAYRLF